MDKIQKRKVTWSTRGTVTRLSYRKWRVRARSLSTETAATDNKETPDVVQAVLPWSSLNQQYAVKFLSSSAILDATKSGWHMRPTRRSEAAKEPKRTKDGVWRSRVFFIARRIEELATNVTTPKNMLRMQVEMFVTIRSCALSKLIPVKWKQVVSVLFMVFMIGKNIWSSNKIKLSSKVNKVQSSLRQLQRLKLHFLQVFVSSFLFS